jgi:hypothetical protein
MTFETELRNRTEVVPSVIIKAGKHSVTTNLEVENLSRKTTFDGKKHLLQIGN